MLQRNLPEGVKARRKSEYKEWKEEEEERAKRNKEGIGKEGK